MESNKQRQIINFGLTRAEMEKTKDDVEIKKIMVAFWFYSSYCQFIVDSMVKNYTSIEPKYLTKLSFTVNDKLQKIGDGVNLNQNFFNDIADFYANEFYKVEVNECYLRFFLGSEEPFIRKMFLLSLVREWADEGKEERDLSFGQTIKELKNFYDYENKELMEKGVKVLVPGCRFCRMVYELGKLGYKVEGNESNLFYSLVDDYFFNHSKMNQFQICPRIHSFCSSYTEDSVTRRYSVPNADIQKDLQNVKEGDLTFNKGEFFKVYKDKSEMFDAVVTIFGMENTINIIQYIDTVYNILKKGGVWINFGGLNYSYSSSGYGIDLTWDELKKVIINFGFEIKREETPVIPYIRIKGCSLPCTCGAIFFSAVKK